MFRVECVPKNNQKPKMMLLTGALVCSRQLVCLMRKYWGTGKAWPEHGLNTKVGFGCPSQISKGRSYWKLISGGYHMGRSWTGPAGRAVRVTIVGKHALLLGFHQRGTETLFANSSSCP